MVLQNRCSTRYKEKCIKTKNIVPFFNIPDLTGFNLKPYVSHATAKIDPASHELRKVSMTPELLAQIDEMIKNAPKENL